MSVFNCTFRYIVRYFLYHNMDIHTMWHCTLVSSTPSRSIGLAFGCALFWCWVPLGVPFSISFIELYFIMFFLRPWFTFRNTFYAFSTWAVLVLQMQNSLDVSAPGHSPWILNWTSYLWTPLSHVYIPYWDILQGSSRLCNWLSLWRLVPWINHSPPVCKSASWKSSLKW